MTQTTERNRQLDILATGSRCSRSTCGAAADEPCRTPNGKPTEPHKARLDRAVRARVQARAAYVDYGVIEVRATVDVIGTSATVDTLAAVVKKAIAEAVTR